MENKKLKRSSTDVKILGVCAGVAEYFGWDSVWVRVAWAVLSVGSLGTCILLYFIMAFIMPKD